MTSREARVSDSGCGIYLTAGELRALGINPDDLDTVEYAVTESGLVVTPPGGEE